MGWGMFVLYLQPIEIIGHLTTAPVARAETPEDLIKAIIRDQVEPYQDGKYIKYYRKGSPLEWFHRPSDPTNHDSYITDVGDIEEWLEAAAHEWEQRFMTIPEVGKMHLYAVDRKKH